MLSIQDIDRGSTGILTTEKNRLGAGRTGNAFLGGEVTLRVTPLNAVDCQGIRLVAATFHPGVGQEVVNARWVPHLTARKLYQWAPLIDQISYLWRQPGSTNVPRQCQ